jgi:two-component system sensor histidine kinase MprB
MSLRTRLALGSAAAMVVVVVVVAGLVYATVRDQMRSRIDQQLRERAALVVPLAVSLDPGVGPGPAGRTFQVPATPLGRAAGLVQLVSPTGVVRGPIGIVSPGLPIDDVTLRVAAGRRPGTIEDARVGGAHVRLLTTPAPGVGAVQIALPLDDVDAVLRRLRWAMLLIGTAGVAMAGILAAAVARAGLAPVRRLDRTAEEVAHTGDLTRRIEVGGNDEVGRLARTFNDMLATLEGSQEAQRQLVVDASHELRTPLTALRTNIEVLTAPEGTADGDHDRLVADIAAQLEDLSTLVADVVSLARGSEIQEEVEDIALDDLVRAAVERASRDTPGLRWSVSTEPCVVRGAPGQLSRALTNLLDNAAKWSPPGGEVEVAVTGGEVVVRDRGPGIAPEDLPHVFDRFYRAPGARRLPGSGLGLAIVRQAAEVHGGGVVAEAAPGGGALLRLRLPVVHDPLTP